MKKLAFVLLGILSFMIPSFAQGLDLVEEVPVAREELKKADIPNAVVTTVARDFKDYVPAKFSAFPFDFQKYGWVVNTKVPGNPDQYEVNLVTSDGSYMDAVYSSTGDLIRYRKIIKNEALPFTVTQSIAKSDYKDWTIVGDKELISSNMKDVVDHYIVRLKKGNQTRHVYIDQKGVFLSNKS
jgi:hypothetical protein